MKRVLLSILTFLIAQPCFAQTKKTEKQQPYQPIIAAADLSPGVVRVDICEDEIPIKEEWPAVAPPISETFTAEAFGFSRMPHKYVDTGIRGDRPIPYLMRASALVDLPPGKHRLLLRGRGATRLLIDGKTLLTTRFPPPITDGHNDIRTDYLDLGPDFRFAPPGNREKWTYFTSKGGSQIVILESIIGGRRGKGILRPELGETVASIALEGSDTFHLIAPKIQVPYTDAGWKVYAARENARIANLEAERRAQAFAKHAPEWKIRRDLAAKWLASEADVKIPDLPSGYPAHNAIDHFLAVKLAEASAASKAPKGSVDFENDVRPLFEARCFSCHQGKKVKGGLRLTADGVRLGGDSELPALAPGHPGKSEIFTRVVTKEKSLRMPPTGDPLTPKEQALLERWIKEGGSWSSSRTVNVTGLTDDLTFLRRATLDTVGVVPTPAEIDAFLNDKRPDRRTHLLDRLLADPRWADHWVGYWQDVLAENPNILNPTLNNTGPYRWWIHEAMLDNKPMDLFVTELILMGGSHYLGGPAGFAMASQSDVPMAEKAAIVSSAFLGVQLKCARCHDAPAHKSLQKDTFQLAALLAQKTLPVPATSSVPIDKLHGKGRKALINVTLKPGSKIAPAWPFAEFLKAPPKWLDKDATSREKLAAYITSPENERFAQVIANRLWKRLMGRGIVEPVDDWEKGEPSHPELLRYLGRELVRGDYDLKHLARVIMLSHAYQRAVDPELKETDPLQAAPARRRLSAEQIVDSLFLAAGKTMDTEEINLDVDGGRDRKNSISLGRPTRAWQFASTSNERDRPSLALPRVQAVVDVLEAFGWRSSRQFPLTDRDVDPNVLQPAIVANGVMGAWLTRLSDDHGVTQLSLADQPLEKLVDGLFMQVLTRQPTKEEKSALLAHLSVGYSGRILEPLPAKKQEKRPLPKYVSWSNHLTPEANEVKVLLEAQARRGAPPTCRLDATWRQRMEDALWALLNSPEFVFRP